MATVPDYIADHVARQAATHAAAHAAYLDALRRRAMLHPYFVETSDPTVSGPQGITGYAWITARGD